MDSKTSKYVPKTIYLDKEDVEKLEEIVDYTGLNPSQIFRRILANINKEDLETKEEKFKRLSKSGNGKLIKKSSEGEKTHMDDLRGIIDDGENVDSVETVRRMREGGYR